MGITFHKHGPAARRRTSCDVHTNTYELVEYGPQHRTIQIDDGERCYLYFPYLQFHFFKGEGEPGSSRWEEDRLYITSSTESTKDPEVTLRTIPLPNCDGGMCLGNRRNGNGYFFKDAKEAIEYFWNSMFTVGGSGPILFNDNWHQERSWYQKLFPPYKISRYRIPDLKRWIEYSKNNPKYIMSVMEYQTIACEMTGLRQELENGSQNTSQKHPETKSIPTTL